MNEENSVEKTKSAKWYDDFRVRVAGTLCSFAVLAAPAANACEPPPPAKTYCDVKPILTAKCTSCHTTPPAAAPFPLLTYAHTIATAPSGQKVWVSMKDRINRASTAGGFMPMGSTLSDADKATLNTWLNLGSATADPPSGGCQ